MNRAQDLKAGPSDNTFQRRRPSQWQRSIQILCIFLVLLLGYATLRNFLPLGEGRLWNWNLLGEESVGRKSSKGTQYLLGVGKADITGYMTMSVTMELSLTILLDR